MTEYTKNKLKNIWLNYRYFIIFVLSATVLAIIQSHLDDDIIHSITGRGVIGNIVDSIFIATGAIVFLGVITAVVYMTYYNIKKKFKK